MAVCLVAPAANTVPSGRNIAGPSSCEPELSALVSGSCTTVLPAEVHLPVDGEKISDAVRLDGRLASTVRILPFGKRVQPSSSKMSALPEPHGVQVSVLGSR